jgi:hypothetical protein
MSAPNVIVATRITGAVCALRIKSKISKARTAQQNAFRHASQHDLNSMTAPIWQG